jgi:AraC family transcriptional regulator
MAAETHWRATQTNRIASHDLVMMRGGPAGAHLDEHAHPELQITLRYATGLAHAEGCRPLAQVSLWAPHQRHRGGWPSGWETLVLHLSPKLMEAAADELVPKGRFELCPIQNGRDALLEELGTTLLSEFQAPETRSSFYLDSMAAFLAARLVRNNGISHAPHLPLSGLDAIQWAALQRFIQSNLESGFTVAEMARAANLPPHRFAASLRITTGASPWEFVQSKRIEAARQMLRNRGLSLAELACRLGFSSQSHFTRVFRRATGFTPAAYRKLL